MVFILVELLQVLGMLCSFLCELELVLNFYAEQHLRVICGHLLHVLFRVAVLDVHGLLHQTISRSSAHAFRSLVGFARPLFGFTRPSYL